MGERGDRLRRMQEIETQILKAVHQICIRHQLRYYLIYGTLLGAVRHKGFIPWDDDIDLGMPYPDYEKFMEYSMKELPDYYQVRLPYGPTASGSLYLKIVDTRTYLIQDPLPEVQIGVYIDIFPLFGCPGDPKVLQSHRKHFLILERLYTYYFRHPRGCSAWWRWTIRFLLNKTLPHLIPQKTLYQWIYQMLLKYPYDESDKCGTYMVGYIGEKQFMDKKIFGDPTPISFEGETFLGVTNPDAFLKQVYGDYWKLPPEDKRYEHHQYSVFFEEERSEFEEFQKSLCENR